jgi:pyruvate kinase
MKVLPSYETRIVYTIGAGRVDYRALSTVAPSTIGRRQQYHRCAREQAAKTAEKLNARSIMVFYETGAVARAIVRLRSRAWVVASVPSRKHLHESEASPGATSPLSQGADISHGA